jgi:hypothetical protein
LKHRDSTVLWIAVAAALSPSLVDLGAHVVANPWVRGTAIFPLLLAWCAFTDPAPSRPARDGLPLLLLGVAAAFVGVGGGMPRVGRPGIALAVIGVARMTGRPSLPVALLAIWLVPLPTQFVEALAPGLDGLVARAAAQLGSFAGVPAEADARRVTALWFVTPSGPLQLFPGDGGLALAWTFAGLGWFAALQRRLPIAACARAALRWSITALPLQIAALAIACVAALFGAPAASRGWLDLFPLLATLVGVAWAVHSRTPQRAALSGDAPPHAGAPA